MVAATRLKLTEVKKEHPNNPIILVGMHSGAALACQVSISGFLGELLDC